MISIVKVGVSLVFNGRPVILSTYYLIKFKELKVRLFIPWNIYEDSKSVETLNERER